MRAPATERERQRDKAQRVRVVIEGMSIVRDVRADELNYTRRERPRIFNVQHIT